MATDTSLADPLPFDEQTLSLTLEFVRASRTRSRWAKLPEAEQLYLLREPDNSGRYIDFTFSWSTEVRAALATLENPGQLEGAIVRLAEPVQRFLDRSPWSTEYAPRVEDALNAGRLVVITITSAAVELYKLPWEFLPIGEHPAMSHPRCLIRYDWPDDRFRPTRARASTVSGTATSTSAQMARRC